MISNLAFADVNFFLALPYEVTLDTPFQPFQTDCTKKDISVQYHEVELLPQISSRVMHRDVCFAVYDADSIRTRSFYDPVTKDRIAVVEHNRQMARIDVYLRKGKWGKSASIRTLFNLLPIEDILLRKDRFKFHASAVSSPYGAVLFAGPSGVGKSTQAELWKRLEGSVILNGDQPILGKRSNVWHVYGSPYAGSSSIYLNVCKPVTAIVMLEQGEECRIAKLSIKNSFVRLYANAFINVWDQEYVHKMCELLSELSAQVPVFHMVCTPDKNAVEMLKSALKQECGDGI